MIVCQENVGQVEFALNSLFLLTSIIVQVLLSNLQIVPMRRSFLSNGNLEGYFYETQISRPLSMHHRYDLTINIDPIELMNIVTIAY